MTAPEHVVFFSGGVGSWYAARLIRHLKPTLLFADTRVEAPDLYEFVTAAAAALECKLVKIEDGRTPFEVFRDERFLGNSRIASCSKLLKQKPSEKWIKANCDPAVTTLYVGIDWSEVHRLAAIEKGWSPYVVRAPLTEPPYVTKPQMLETLEADGLTMPSAYADGFPHNNCMQQGCVRGGQAYWQHLLRTRRSSYLYSEEQEEGMRKMLDRPVSILKERRGAVALPLSLREFRERIETQPELFDDGEWGGCGCFTEQEEK